MSRSISAALAATLVALVAASAAAATTAELVAEGNAAYAEARFDEALQKYVAAQVSDPTDAVIQYDIGNVLFRLGRHEEALRAFQAAAETSGAVAVDADYNAGGVWFTSGAYQEALDSYRRALEADPSALDAKYNFELALRKLRQPPPEPEAEPPPDEHGSDDSAEDQAPRPAPQGPPPPSPEKRPGDAPRPQELEGMDREQAEQLLDALERAEGSGTAPKSPAAEPPEAGIDW